MDWSDVFAVARCVSQPTEIDFQEGWMNGEAEIV